RERLNQTYDRFVSRFGPLSERVNARAFIGDPDLPLLLSLESFDQETRKAAKTAIFRERTIQRHRPIESADSPKTALIVSLNERGRVDLEHMARLLGRSAEEFLPELKGVVFLNPESRRWETEDQYLSGNVREKLVAAEKASQLNTRYRDNVEALKTVQPEDLAASDIDARLGAAWIPASDVQRFVRELLDADDASVRHIPQLGSWIVQAGY